MVMNDHNDDILLYGFIKLNGLHKYAQLILLSSLVFVFFLLYGIMQEKIYHNWKKYDIKLGWFLTFFQCALYSIFNYLGKLSYSFFKHYNEKEKLIIINPTPTTSPNIIDKNKPPFKSYIFIGILSLLTIGLSNVSIEHLSYHTQVVFKSTKPIPVMIMGMIILKKKYNFIEIISFLLISIGLIIFSTTDLNISPEFEPLGVFIICSALFIDGIIGNVQQKLFIDYPKTTASDMIMYTKLIASLGALIISTLLFQLPIVYRYTFEINPGWVVDIVLYSILGCLGEIAIMALIKSFGALTTVIVTSLRKCVSIIFSFILFPKPFSFLYIVGASLIFTGVILNEYYKNKFKYNDNKMKVINENNNNNINNNHHKHIV